MCIITAVASATTERTQVYASGEEQCDAMCSASARVIAVSRYSNMSPAQSSDTSPNGGVSHASCTAKTPLAQAKATSRAARGAHRKEWSSW